MPIWQMYSERPRIISKYKELWNGLQYEQCSAILQLLSTLLLKDALQPLVFQVEGKGPNPCNHHPCWCIFHPHQHLSLLTYGLWSNKAKYSNALNLKCIQKHPYPKVERNFKRSCVLVLSPWERHLKGFSGLPSYKEDFFKWGIA